MLRKLSILVPVYNEVATVEQVLWRVAAVSFPIEREIVVVDDGSSDGSRQVLERLASTGLIQLIKHDTNKGKGAAVRTALRHARGQILVVQDADLELNPADLPTLLEPILSREAQVCYGSRFMNGIPWTVRRRPTYWGNIALNKLSNFLNGIRITDFNTCYKMMTREVLARVSITENGFAMEPEITAKIAQLGHAIVERPVRYEPRGFGDGKKIRVRDAIRYVYAMLRYRFLWSAEATSVPRMPTLEHRSAPLASVGS